MVYCSLQIKFVFQWQLLGGTCEQSVELDISIPPNNKEDIPVDGSSAASNLPSAKTCHNSTSEDDGNCIKIVEVNFILRCQVGQKQELVL